jgi:hypothetical protein
MIERTQWRIEHLGQSGRWRQIGFPQSLTEAHSLFERAIRDYPSDHLVRLVDGDRVLQIAPATWCFDEK